MTLEKLQQAVKEIKENFQLSNYEALNVALHIEANWQQHKIEKIASDTLSQLDSINKNINEFVKIKDPLSY